MSKVLAITGRVLPVTNENVRLEATFENGATVLGESNIFYCKKEQDCRIQPRPPAAGASQGAGRRRWRPFGRPT